MYFFYALKWAENAGNALIEVADFKNFPGVHAPGPPQETRAFGTRSPPNLALSPSAMLKLGEPCASKSRSRVSELLKYIKSQLLESINSRSRFSKSRFLKKVESSHRTKQVMTIIPFISPTSKLQLK